jgi:hypothetical protein
MSLFTRSEGSYDEVRQKLKVEQEVSSSKIRRTRTMYSYIPLRLSSQERRLLMLLEAALHVSEYTDRVDIYNYQSQKIDRIQEQVHIFCGVFFF